MKCEISTLFNLIGYGTEVNKRLLLGDGVYIEPIEPDWLEVVKKQCPDVEARERLERIPEYTHRFYYEINPQLTELSCPTNREKQLLYSAIVLSRITKPTAIAYENVYVKSFYYDTGKIEHHNEVTINSLSVAYVPPGEEDNVITEGDVQLIAAAWPGLKHIQTNEPYYRRIMRAIKRNEFASATYFAEEAYGVFHSALESLIYFGGKKNKAQITQRLPQLFTGFISQQDAENIYKLHNAFKHEAEALQQILTSDGSLDPQEEWKRGAIVNLCSCVRKLLYKAFTDLSFAELLVDHSKMKQQFPVTTRQGTF